MVPADSDGVPPAPPYSGYSTDILAFIYGTITPYGTLSHVFLFCLPSLFESYNPAVLCTTVWAIPLSLATTYGITIVFFSSRYLDVSVP